VTASIDHPEGIRQLAPGATLGVIGGGQLGRYFALKARQFGYSVWVLDPDANAPAMQIATVPLVAKYDDEQALLKLAHACDGVTIEFENVPAHSLELLQQHTQVAPGAKSVELAQDRLLEKQKASACGLLSRVRPYWRMRANRLVHWHQRLIMSVCWRSSSLSMMMACCTLTRWHPGRITAVITHSMPPFVVSSNNSYVCCAHNR